MASRAHSSPSHDFPPPRGNVLLLSCMDLRLIDDIVHFTTNHNMTNRYDQFILAGVGLGADKKPWWKEVFFEHVKAACELHNVRDVYILEHRHCGAYEKFLGKHGHFGDTPEEQARELEMHRDFAWKLADKVNAFARENSLTVNVRCFLMDLRGQVEVLERPGGAVPLA